MNSDCAKFLNNNNTFNEIPKFKEGQKLYINLIISRKNKKVDSERPSTQSIKLKKKQMKNQ